MATTSPVVKKVAVVQAASVAFDVVGSIAKLARLAKEARAAGARLVLFPEAFVSCYPRGASFGAVVGSRSPEGRDLYRQYHESSIDIPGPAIDSLSEIAKENSIYLVVGVVEREGGTLFCTVVFFDDRGRYLGKHRKLMPTASERLVWGFGDGSTLPVFDTPIGKLSAAICWENYMPLLRMTLYSKGVQIYCAPTADGRDTWLSSMRHIACEGRCFVLSCNQFVRKSDLPEVLATAFDGDQNTVVSRGGSCIIDPFGEILSGPNYESEAILYAEIDLGQIVRAKFDFDVVGHYARPDVFTLHVNERPNQAVVTRDRNAESESLDRI